MVFRTILDAMIFMVGAVIVTGSFIVMIMAVAEELKKDKK